MSSFNDKPPSYEEATGSESFSSSRKSPSAPFLFTSSPEEETSPAEAGWKPLPLAEEVTKEKEVLAEASSNGNHTEENTTVYPELPEKCPQPNVIIPATSPCPPGLETLVFKTELLVRETYVQDPRGGTCKGGEILHGEHILLRVQRCPRAHQQRHAPRSLEIVEASGGSVIARLESTKRSEIYSVEVKCPPDCRISRAELRAGPLPPQLTASILSADEKTVLRITNIPPLGELETQPVLQIEDGNGESCGNLQWAWSTEADLIQAQIQLTSQVDVRIKLGTIALSLLCMEAFSSRWSRDGSSRHHRSPRIHNLRGHRKRHHR